MRIYGYYFGLTLLATAAWVCWQWPSSQISVTVCDVGQGDGIIIQEGFSQMVIDTGPPGLSMVSCLGETMPFWDRHLEAVIISHADSDHSGGLKEISQRLRIREVITTQASVEELRALLVSGTRLTVAQQGDRWQFGSVAGEVLWPARTTVCRDENYCSLVVRLSHQTDSMLLTGDINMTVEEQLLRTGLLIPTNYVKISHHGAAGSTGNPFLSILQPRQVWISVGKENRYGHPNPDTLLRINRIGTDSWRTDQQGTLRFNLR